MVRSLNYAQALPLTPEALCGRIRRIQTPVGNLLAISSNLISLSLNIIICEMRAVLSPSPRLLEEKVRESRGHHTAYNNQCSENGDSLSPEQVTSMLITEEQARI